MLQRLLLGFSQRCQVSLGGRGVGSLYVLKRTQRVIPTLLEGPSDQTVVRIAGIVLTLGEPRGVARPLQPELLLVVQRLTLPLDRIECPEQDLEL